MQVPCPNCGAPVTWGPQATFRPFCSKRCRLIDLGEWLKEDRRLPAEPSLDGFDSDDLSESDDDDLTRGR
jgi:endogenous inhibitor of DNA gyrase (YacG/DUF329 family)